MNRDRAEGDVEDSGTLLFPQGFEEVQDDFGFESEVPAPSCIPDKCGPDVSEQFICVNGKWLS